jgi:hypothetical protein
MKKNRDLRTRVAICTEGDDGIFENVLRTVTDISLMCNVLLFKHEIKIKINLTVSNLSLLPFTVLLIL